VKVNSRPRSARFGADLEGFGSGSIGGEFVDSSVASVLRKKEGGTSWAGL
jgi:hypothetical protein